MIFLRLLPILSALLFILSRRIDVRVTKAEELTVKISFNIFAIVLTEDKIKKRGLKKLSKLIKSRRSILKSADYLISKSNVRLYKFISTDPSVSVPLAYNAYREASVYFISAYLERTARKFSFSAIRDTDKNAQNQVKFNLLLHFPFSHLIISALIFLYYIVKNRVKRVLQNV